MRYNGKLSHIRHFKTSQKTPFLLFEDRGVHFGGIVLGKHYAQLQRQGRLLRSRITEGMVFLRRFVGAPRQVGSVVPSSPYLTRAVLDKIDWSEVRNVAELGAGTGVFTRSIVRRARPDAQLLVFEIDPDLQRMIGSGHPGLRLYGDAQELPAILEDLKIDKLDCIVSSLPFTVLPPTMTERILDAVQDTLAPSGKFVAYQYSRIMKAHFESRFSELRTSFVPINVPPAFVYECRGDRRKK